MGAQEIPVALASAGIRRALALAYFLVWAWHEHGVASELLGRERDRRVVVLVDEPETHLHPRWQRQLVPSVLGALTELTKPRKPEMQIIVATHAPLVLASLEPIFDVKRDELFLLDVNDVGRVVVRTGAWAKQGDAANWLVSEVFGLEQARSAEAERAIEAAEAFMRDDKKNLPKDLKTQAAIHEELKRLLPAHDAFWPRWLVSPGKALPLVRREQRPLRLVKRKRKPR
jgi:predicted ATP-binding protein involved in virulence